MSSPILTDSYRMKTYLAGKKKQFGLGRFDTLIKSKYSDIFQAKEPEANSGN